MEWLGSMKGEGQRGNQAFIIHDLLSALRKSAEARGIQSKVEDNCLYGVKGGITLEACFEKVGHDITGSIRAHSAQQATIWQKARNLLLGLALIALLAMLGGFGIALLVRFLHFLSLDQRFFAQLGYTAAVAFFATVAIFGIVSSIGNSSQQAPMAEMKSLIETMKKFAAERNLYVEDSHRLR